MSCGMPATIRVPFRELAQEGEAAGRCRRVDRTRDEEAVATLLERPGRRDQRAAPGRRLDDDGRVGQAADDPVPARERPEARADVRRQLGHDRSARRRRSHRRAGCGPAGGGRRGPTPMTATVVPWAWTAAAWAAPSMPTARPGDDGRPDLDQAGRRCGPRRTDRALVARRVPTIGDRGVGTQARRCRRGRTAGAVASRSRPAAPDRPDPRSSRPRGRARGSGRGSVRRVGSLGDRVREGRRQAVARGPPARPASASPASTIRSGPPGAEASRRIATPLPYRSSRTPNPTGPRPSTPARTAQASRSAGVGPSRSVADVALARHGRRRSPRRRPADTDAQHVSAPRRPTAASRSSGTTRLRRDAPRSRIVELGEVGDRPRHAQDPLGAPAARPLELGELDDAVARRPSEPARLAQRAAGQPAVQDARRARRAPCVARPRCATRRRRSLPGPSRGRAVRRRPAASGSRGRSGRGAAPRSVADSAPGRAAGRCTRGPTSRRTRTDMGSSRPPAGTGPGTSSRGRPARSRRGRPRAAGGAPRARRDRIRAARRGTGRLGRPG